MNPSLSRQNGSVVILTGAGISAASGLDTFRDSTGVWARYDYRDVATPQGFARDPAKVHEFYNMRRREALVAQPNAAHLALSRLEEAWPGEFLLVTQNVDGLHEAAGSRKLLHMHGELNSALCLCCGARFDWTEDTGPDSICPQCGESGHLRPDIVWFGEMPYHMEAIDTALAEADLFVAIGTSGTVYPAAGFVELARTAGAETIEVNLEPSENGYMFDRHWTGPAVETVPQFVESLLRRHPG